MIGVLEITVKTMKVKQFKLKKSRQYIKSNKQYIFLGILKKLVNSVKKLKLDKKINKIKKYLIHLNQEKEQEATGDSNITCICSMQEMIEFDIKFNDEELFRHTVLKLNYER